MNSTFYRTIQVDGLSIFYREAGPTNGETILLLHGLPSSSRMFEPLFARLSDRYHLIAPDYPGFGHSDWPDPGKFAYTFDHLAETMNHFTEALGLSRYTLYMQDYGGPVGFRMALEHPERVEALIVQDAVAHNRGLGANWKTRRAFWADRAANESALRTNLLSLEAARARHVGTDPDVERHDPDLWTDESYFLNRPGQAEIQSDLFYDYRANVDSYPKWQAWMREKQPRLLVIWGKYETSFDPSEPESYREDVPNAEVHIVDGGHFALDTAADEIASSMRNFMASSRETDSISKRRTTMTTKGKVLVLVSSGHGLPLKDGKVYTGAGYYLNELTVPVRALMNEGYEITFANPKGNTPQMDVHSAVADFFGGDEAKLQDYLKFRDTLTGLKNPTRISDVIASGLDQYDAVFVPGGHGPMMDLLDDPDAGAVMRHFHKTSKPTAVLCHGPISLLSALPNSTEVVAALSAGDAAGARAKAQGWIYSGYKMTIFSTAEEQQREPLEIGGKVLFYPDFALSTAGGDVSVLEPWKSYVLQDRELISGQNPFSDEALLKLLLPALNKKKLDSAA